MTFIASVIAKKGVAIVSDSLVTSSLPILHFNKFIQHLDEQPKSDKGDISIDPGSIISLFNYEPIYTKDYEEKLFRLNKYTAITTTGIASINGKKNIDIVNNFIAFQHDDIENFAIPIEEKINQFVAYVTNEVQEHLEKFNEIGECVFIITFYDTVNSNTHIFKARITETDKSALNEQQFEFLVVNKEPEFARVVCDGQNKLSENILYGIGKSLYNVFPKMVEGIVKKLKVPEENVPEDFISQLLNDDFFKDTFLGDIELLKLSDLSLQQAVDLASLLMRLEVDFQKYTRDVPTVGGVIKLAVIDERGFEFISGHTIEKPKHIII